MKFAVFSVLASLTLGAQAHFRLLYPEPRGEFVADRQPLFCGGYDNVGANRTTFPLSNGFFQIRQGHADWAATVLISTAANPSSFDDFRPSAGSDEFYHARYWANESLVGNFCIPLDLSDLNIPGVEDGANVTIQVALTGGDGELYQCADLTLSADFELPSELQSSCVNQTKEDDHHAAPTETAPGASETGGNNAALGGWEHMSLVKAVGVAVVGAVVGVVSL